jgi:8-oxo-dGTP diphosphatase
LKAVGNDVKSMKSGELGARSKRKGVIMLIESSRHIRVVVAAVERQDRYLITKRRAGGTLPGVWQFPSGKVQGGETDETALKRELRERVGVDVEVGRMRAHRTHHYAGYDVDLVLYEASISLAQELRSVHVADFRWVTAQELEQYPFPPADQLTTDLLLGIGQQQRDGDLAIGDTPVAEGIQAPRTDEI